MWLHGPLPAGFRLYIVDRPDVKITMEKHPILIDGRFIIQVNLFFNRRHYRMDWYIVNVEDRLHRLQSIATFFNMLNEMADFPETLLDTDYHHRANMFCYGTYKVL